MKLIKYSLATLSLITATNTLAALPGTTDPTAVNLAESPGEFILGVTGYYLKPIPSNGDLAYATVGATSSSQPISNSGLLSPETDYNLGYGINLGYIFANTPFDINLSYFHLDTDKFNASVVGTDSIKQVTNLGPDSALVGTVRNDAGIAAAQYSFNQVDLTAGEYVNYGNRVRVHPNVGLRYASVDREINSFYVLNPPIGNSRPFFGNTTITEDSDFQGFGPLVGLDSSFYIGDGFGAVAHADYSLLYGEVDATSKVVDSFTITLFSPPRTTIYPVNFKNEDGDRFAQIVDLKLGGDYSYLFNQNNNTYLTLEVGYQYSNYIDVVDRLEAQLRSNLSNIITISKDSVVRAVHTSNLGLEGPYASLTLHV